MEKHQHLRLPLFQGDVERQKRNGGGGYSLPAGRNKSQFSKDATEKAENISSNFSTIKKQLSDKIDPSLIFEIEINQGVYPNAFEQTLGSMGIHILSVSEGKKGFLVVFSEDEDLRRFKQKLSTYGSEEGANYDFFNAIESFSDIHLEKRSEERRVERV